jgi:hypothetical protein
MINTDLDFAQEIYGGEEIWYVYIGYNGIEGKIKGPYNFYKAEQQKDGFIDACQTEDESFEAKVFIDWEALRNCTEKMFGK